MLSELSMTGRCEQCLPEDGARPKGKKYKQLVEKRSEGFLFAKRLSRDGYQIMKNLFAAQLVDPYKVGSVIPSID